MTARRPGRNASVAPEVALATLWHGLRVVVCDTETCTEPGVGHRIISLAMVALRRGVTCGSYTTLVNPGVPIDDKTARVHHLSDAHLVDAPRFSDIASDVTNWLTPADGEDLVLVGHFLEHDLGALTREFDLASIPFDAPNTCDTSRLSVLVGVKTHTGKLASLLEALELGNPNAHDALADAAATAAAFSRLLTQAASQGWTDIGDLCEQTSVTDRPWRSSGPSPFDQPEPDIPLEPDHIDTHTVTLAGRASPQRLDAWVAGTTECVSTCCAHLPDRVAVAAARPHTAALVAPRLAEILDAALATNQPGQVASAVGAALVAMPATLARRDVLTWHDQHADALAAAARCGTRPDQRCPWCRRGDPCPLDVWPELLAAIHLGVPDGALVPKRTCTTFLSSNGTGHFYDWMAAGRRRLAGHAAWLVVHAWDVWGNTHLADTLAGAALDAGALDGNLAARRALAVAEPDTEAGIAAALAALAQDSKALGPSTSDGALAVQARQRQLSSRLSEVRMSVTGTTGTGDRLHHPMRPRRMRRNRFKPAPVLPPPTDHEDDTLAS